MLVLGVFKVTENTASVENSVTPARIQECACVVSHLQTGDETMALGRGQGSRDRALRVPGHGGWAVRVGTGALGRDGLAGASRAARPVALICQGPFLSPSRAGVLVTKSLEQHLVCRESRDVHLRFTNCPDVMFVRRWGNRICPAGLGCCRLRAPCPTCGTDA